MLLMSPKQGFVDSIITLRGGKEMTKTELDGKKVLKLSRALMDSGLHPGPAVPNFLQRKGYTLDEVASGGGTMPILMGMMPDDYPTVEKLVEAIKATC
jgi:hypothetical protein